MKLHQLAAVGAAVWLIMPGALAKNTPPARAGQNMSAMQEVTVNGWKTRIERELERHLRYPVDLYGNHPGRGLVRVKFRCSESGRPVNVALARSSGKKPLDRAALDAVRRMNNLHPLPAGFPEDQRFAALVYLSDFQDAEADRDLRRMKEEADRDNSWLYEKQIAAGEKVITLGAG